MKFYEIQHFRMAGSIGICTEICCPFFCETTYGKILNFFPLNLRMLNGKESIKAIKLIAPPKYTVNSLPQPCLSLFSSH